MFNKLGLMKIILPIIILLTAGCTNKLALGVKAFRNGDYDIAAAYWNPLAKKGNPVAQYNLGLLWEYGLGSTPQNDYEAASWYLLAAKKNFVPAMVRLAMIRLKYNFRESAISWLKLAARWGNENAINMLKELNEPVPSADLLDNTKEEKKASAQNFLLFLFGVSTFIDSYYNGNNSYDIDIFQYYLSDKTNVSIDENTKSLRSCTSDYGCGPGYRCAKEPFHLNGICVENVDNNGIRNYSLPSQDGGVDIKTSKECRFNSDCPLGFKCDNIRKICIRY